MSDYNSSLPVRTENNGDVVAQLVDGTITTQKLAIDSSGRVSVKNFDGAGNSLTSQVNGGQQALDVGIDVGGVQIDPRSIRALTASDVVTAQQGTSPWTIQGDSASGASKAGNPVQIGGVFNTTQPTVTTGQTVEAQSTARGALIVATGVDNFNINNISGTISLPTGASTSALQTTGNTSLASIVTNTNPLNLAQGSTTSGQTGNLSMGAVTTAAPTYVTGQTDPLSLTTSGALRVDGSGSTQPVSGTVTANQGTSPWITKDQSDGPVTPGTVASFSQLAGGQFNTTPPTLTTGQQAALQVTSSGALIVSSTLSNDTNYGTVGANTLRSAAQIGNATGAADFNFGTVGAQTLRTAAEIGNATGIADFNAGATGAQTLRTTANQGTPGTAANGWFVKPTDGTNSQSFTAAGEAKVDITTSITLTTTSTNFPTTVDTNYGTVGANTLRSAAQIGNATGAADFNNGATGAQTLRVAANLAVAGANVSSTNPVPVSFSAAPLGTAVDDYKTVATLAANATNNHDYTVTAGKTLLLKQIEATGSGKVKIEVQIESGVASNTFASKFVQFNSTATPNMTIDLQDPISVAAGVRVRVIVTNRDNQSQDVYSTICGQEI